MTLFIHKQNLPSFHLGEADQAAVSVYTVLSVNEQGKCCAAYRGVTSRHKNPDVIEKIRAWGQKITETEARLLFPEIADMNLSYRK